jgi:hypothetical protein
MLNKRGVCFIARAHLAFAQRVAARIGPCVGRRSLVTNTRVCNKVVATFRTSVAADWPPPIPTALYVVKVGTVCVEAHYAPPPPPDPGTIRTGRSIVGMVVDAKYKLLSTHSY